MSGGTGPGRTARGLAEAAHPLPCVAVTVFAAGLGVVAGASASTTLVLAAAVLTGQLTIGWLNDLRDAGLDVSAARSDKPVARGDLDVGVLRIALVVCVPVCVLLSFALGPLPGFLHLVAAGSGWVYDLALKSTPASGLPYLSCFGLLPVVAATAAGSAPSWSLAAAAAMIGLGAHFANTLPDVEADAATGVRGLPQRLGPHRSQLLAGTCVVLSCGIVAVGARGALPAAAAGALATAAVLGAGSVLAPRRLAFRLVLLSAAVALTGIVTAG